MVQNQHVLSVIVPIYNVERYLNRCIESIIGQTYRELEIILVDDGSTDHCGEMCDEWLEKDSRIKVLHKKNGGLVSARQAGLKIASGEYIANVDSDDWIEADMYEYMMELAVNNDSDLVTSGLIRDYENHSVYEQEKLSSGFYTGDVLAHLLHHIINVEHFFDSQLNMHITNKIFRKSKLVQYQMAVPADAKVGEDADVVYPYIFDAKSITVSGKCFYHYVMRSDSIMGISAGHERSRAIMREIFDLCIARNKKRIGNIEQQLGQVITFFMLLSDPSSIFEIRNKKLYPFEKAEKGDRVILYGAGRFGKAVKNLLETERYCKIVAWVDKVENGQIILPTKIKDYSFDKVLLAVINAAVADQAEEMLLQLGIAEKKICRVKV